MFPITAIDTYKVIIYATIKCSSTTDGFYPPGTVLRLEDEIIFNGRKTDKVKLFIVLKHIRHACFKVFYIPSQQIFQHTFSVTSGIFGGYMPHVTVFSFPKKNSFLLDSTLVHAKTK